MDIDIGTTPLTSKIEKINSKKPQLAVVPNAGYVAYQFYCFIIIGIGGDGKSSWLSSLFQILTNGPRNKFPAKIIDGSNFLALGSKAIHGTAQEILYVVPNTSFYFIDTKGIQPSIDIDDLKKDSNFTSWENVKSFIRDPLNLQKRINQGVHIPFPQLYVMVASAKVFLKHETVLVTDGEVLLAKYKRARKIIARIIYKAQKRNRNLWLILTHKDKVTEADYHGIIEEAQKVGQAPAHITIVQNYVPGNNGAPNTTIDNDILEGFESMLKFVDSNVLTTAEKPDCIIVKEAIYYKKKKPSIFNRCYRKIKSSYCWETEVSHKP